VAVLARSQRGGQGQAGETCRVSSVWRLALALGIVLAAQCWRRYCRPRGGLMFHVFVIRAPRESWPPVTLADSLNGLVRSLCRLT
jgi:hypothetical protein